MISVFFVFFVLFVIFVVSLRGPGYVGFESRGRPRVTARPVVQEAREV